MDPDSAATAPEKPAHSAQGGSDAPTGAPKAAKAAHAAAAPAALGGSEPKSGTPVGGFARMNARTKEMAAAKLPPSLRAKLTENARMSTLAPPAPQGGAAPPGAGVMEHNERLDSASILMRKAPTKGPVGPVGPSLGSAAAQPPRMRPRPNLRLSDMGAALPSVGPSASASASASGKRPGPGLSLGALPGAAKPETPFGSFSKIVDPSGRLVFDGKAVLHSSGVEFKNGTTFSIHMDELQLLQKLGHGNYGTVTKVRHTKTGVEMAMKEIRLELDESKLNAIIMELDILHRAIAPQIVEFYGAFFVESCVYYCMEYMDIGSLEKLTTGRHCTLPEDVLAQIALSTVQGLRFLKDELQIIHRDVKPTNMLINARGEVKLCDFGVSGQLEKSLAKTNIGCQSYMAPERIKGDPRSLLNTYTVASDIWSLGISLVELTVGTYPYPPETFTNVFAQLQAIVEGDAPQLPTPSAEPIAVTLPSGMHIELELGQCTYSDTARDFVARCLCKIPEHRPTYAQLLEHPFLTGARHVDMAAWATSAYAARRRLGEEDDASAPTTPAVAAAPT